jgi:hypothetical protein
MMVLPEFPWILPCFATANHKKPAGAPLTQKHGCAVDPKTRKNVPARIPGASWRLTHGLATLKP